MREKEVDNVVTIYDIAKKANVSPMTVSRVINNSGNIRLATREKVERAIKELGYIPNAAARSLTSNKTKTLGLLLTDITNPFFARVARGAEAKAMETGYRILLANTDEDFEKEKVYTDMMISARVDGVIMAPTNDNSLEQIDRLKRHGIPTVLLDRTVQGFEGDCVLGDSYKGSRDLVHHLIDYGHTRIALVNGPRTISTSRERERGYKEALKLNDLPVYENYIQEFDFRSLEPNAAQSIIEKLMLLDEAKRPTAIFASNNFIAISVIQSLEQMNLRVPEDISIVCFDEIEPVVYFDPFFTVAAQPATDFGKISVQYLIERLENDDLEQARKVILPPDIHIRKSTQKI